MDHLPLNSSTAAALKHAANLMQSGQLAQAIAAYRRLLQATPQLADAWYNLGYLLRRSGDSAAALEAYAQALRHGAAQPEQIHLNRAALLSTQLHQDAAAERELQQALRCHPGYPPALLNLGNLHEELGARASAIAAYTELSAGRSTADAFAPLRWEARARLLHLQPPTSQDDPRLSTLQEFATAPTTDTALAATLLHAVAQAYDRLGLHALAFDTAATANGYGHTGWPTYVPERTQQLFGSIGEVFDRAIDSLAAQSPDTSAGAGPEPLFICGMFRSGSSLLEQVLSCHPQIDAAGELDALPRLIAQQLQPFPQAARGLSATMATQLARTYRQRLAAVPAAASTQLRYVTDKRL
ncbi:tetratricopeptide repeat protein, partial [Xanthomonas maliensis]